MKKKNLCGLSADEIQNIIRPGGFERHHAVTISNLIYKKRLTDFSDTSKLPKDLLELLASNSVTEIIRPVTSLLSGDGTEKYLFINRTGLRYEAVFIPEAKRNTVCVSTQSGCRMGCPFCMTARLGFYGNLDTCDIISQVLGIPHAGRITHVVFMGMGEPLDNYENTLKASAIMTSQWGMALSPRNITVSTVGITPAVRRFLGESACNLTLSLFSPFAGERARIIPAEKSYPFSEIIEILKTFPLRKKQRITIAYIMISDVNDTDDHLEGLICLLKGSGIRVNLLPYHPAGIGTYRSSSSGKLMAFKHRLVTSGISASVRKSRGSDISAACGLLAAGLQNSRQEIFDFETNNK